MQRGQRQSTQEQKLMDWLLRWRTFLGLRRVDCEFACGIGLGRLGQAETGRASLNETEIRLLIDFLGRHLESMLAEKGGEVFIPEPLARARCA